MISLARQLDAASTAQPQAHVAELAAARDRRTTVVVIDDTATSRILLAQIIGQISPKLRVELFATPAAAVDFAREHRVDLLVTDYHLPEFNGIEAVRRFRALPHCRDVPMVMVTVDNHRHLVIEALQAGVNDFLLKPFDEHETRARCMNLLELRRHQIAIADRTMLLENKVEQAVADIHARELETLAALARAAEQRDEGTANHVQRMARYCGIIARAMGLPDADAEMIEIAAPLHDIGKLGISDAILLKPGPLTDDEMKLMRTHARIGYDILKGGTSNYLKVGAMIALYHHERYDGAGYPTGLVADAIPLDARIAAVADVFDALITPRPYKEAWTFERALEYMNEQRAKQFDPLCVAGLFARLEDIKTVGRQFS